MYFATVLTIFKICVIITDKLCNNSHRKDAKLNLVNKDTLSEQIYKILRNDIISQTIKCGEKLTLKNLMEKFNVSSTPVREALTRLSQDDLVSYYSNIGVRVVEFEKTDIAQIYDFSRELDCMAVKFAFENSDFEKIADDLSNALSLSTNALIAGDLETFKKNSDNFHDIFYQHSGNSRLIDAAVKIRGQFSILANLYQSYTVNVSIVNEEHAGIYEAVRQKDLEKTLILMCDHFNHSKNYLLNSIENLGRIS